MLLTTEQPDPPFTESQSVVETRSRARRLAVSDLPILVEGEPGTGRRTLANNLTRLRRDQFGSGVLALDGVAGIAAEVRAQLRSKVSRIELVIHNLESFSERDQSELATLVHSKAIRLVAVGKRTSDSALPGERVAEYIDQLRHEVGVGSLILPPLRERNGDVNNWADFFLRRAAERLSLPLPVLGTTARAALMRYRWPGNLVELEAVVSRAVCLSASSTLETSDLGFEDTELRIQPLSVALEQFRKNYIHRTLAYFSGNRSQAARALGVDVRTIFRHLEKG